MLNNVLEDTIGNFIDHTIYELYWNNSLFTSEEFDKIIKEIRDDGICADVITLKKRLFREILRNMIILSHCSTYSGSFRTLYIVPIYVLYNMYQKQVIFSSVDLLFNEKSQLSFLNSIISTTDFPSKYDSREELLYFAKECASLSKFVSEKNCNQHGHTIITGSDYANVTHTHVDSTGGNTTPSSNVSTYPSSIDKIIDSIQKLLESENEIDTAQSHELLSKIDYEMNNLNSNSTSYNDKA